MQTEAVSQASEHIQLLRNIHGREFLEVQHPAVKARISLEGAHLVACVPAGQDPLLWMSPVDPEVPGRPLRGGVPICWPWFADEREGPAHGIARTSHWILKECSTAPHQIRIVQAACEFAQATGGIAAIGCLNEIEQLVAGTAGTQVSVTIQGIDYRRC